MQSQTDNLKSLTCFFCVDVSLLCSECCESPLSESSESNQSTSGIDSDSDSRSGIEEGIPNTGLQKWKLVTHQKWETGWEIHQINSTEVADASKLKSLICSIQFGAVGI